MPKIPNPSSSEGQNLSSIRPLYTGHTWVRACLTTFVLAIAVAMWAYPGGTWWDSARVGHSFWQNFLCDLLHDPSLNHRPNELGSRFARAGMLVFVLGLSVFWSLTGELLCCCRRLSKLITLLGVTGTPLMAAVPLLPSNRFPKLHTTAVTLGGLPALLALMLLAVGFFLEPHSRRFMRLFTAGLVLLVVICLGLYVKEAIFGGPSLRIVPILERIASIAVVLWMAAVLRRRKEPAGHQ